MPGRAAVKTEMERVMIELKANMSSYIREANKVSICAERWSKKGLTASFLGVTCHRIDHRRHCVTLAVRRMPSPHIADHIRDLVDAILEEWDIPTSTVTVVVTDNGSNMVAAFRTYVASLDDSQEDGGESEDDSESEVSLDHNIIHTTNDNGHKSSS